MNWKLQIKRLVEAGLTQAQIAKAIGISQAAISDLAIGKSTEPRYSTGRKLLDLADRCGVREPDDASDFAGDAS